MLLKFPLWGTGVNTEQVSERFPCLLGWEDLLQEENGEYLRKLLCSFPNYKVVIFHGRCCLGNAKHNGNLIFYLDF